ncbi:MAG: hypothetical protein JSR76_05155 [Verrucomicrobia bacterium]|nr:hypothetical protein [Verrucomicrobiota bacterium]
MIVVDDSQSPLVFTEAENKIRKRWLFFSTILPNVVFGCCIIMGIIYALHASDFMALLWILLTALVLAGSIGINYHCAYKNPGTKLLFLMIVGSAISLLNLPRDLMRKENLDYLQTSMTYSLVIFGTAFFNVALLYYSYKLRQINKKMKARKVERLAVAH